MLNPEFATANELSNLAEQIKCMNQLSILKEMRGSGFITADVYADGLQKLARYCEMDITVNLKR